MLVEHMSLHVPCWALPWLNRGGGCGSKKSKSYTSSCGCEAELGSRFLRGGWRKETTPLGHATFLGGMVATSKRRGKMVRPCYLSTPRHFLPAQLFLVSMATKATFIAMLISKKKALISFPALHPPNKENTQWKSTHKTAHLPLKGSVSESNPSQQDVHI